tara:strand:+ start:69 stop:959 length:891 start_codon:yes stop_codon:yes gene_type:complete
MGLLITGAGGLLGSRLINDLFDYGYKLNFSSRNIDLYELPYIDLINSDLDSLIKSLDKIDSIIYTAGMNYKDCKEDPITAIDINIRMVSKLALAARKSNVKKFLYFSTSNVYADISSSTLSCIAQTEVNDIYSASKLSSEILISTLLEYSKIDLYILRLANICCGTNSSKESHRKTILNDLCFQAAKRNKIQINSDPDTHRDFVPFTILKENILKCLSEENNIENKYINITSGKLTKIKDLALMVSYVYKKYYGTKISIYLDYFKSFLDYNHEMECNLIEGMEGEILKSLSFYLKN